jgi:hypothetical protein
LRLVTTATLVAGFLLFEGLRGIAGADLPILLYGAYAAQLSLALIVFLALFRRRLSARGAIGSVVFGLAATAAYVTYAVISKDQANAYVQPPFFALVGGILGYAMCFRLPKRSDPTPKVSPP